MNTTPAAKPATISAHVSTDPAAIGEHSGITYLPPAHTFAMVRAAKVTIYRTGEFFGGVHKIEARDVEIRIVSWAQYSHAIEVTYTPKGARKARRYVDSYNPSTLVLAGWGCPDPESLWDETTRREGDGVSSVRSKHTPPSVRQSIDSPRPVAHGFASCPSSHARSAG